MNGLRSRVGVSVSLALVLAFSGLAVGQFTLATPFDQNNGQAGNMFDVVAANAVTLTDFDINANPGTWDVEIWSVNPATWTGGAGTTPGSILQNAATPTTMADWTMEALIMGVVSTAVNAPTNVGAGTSIALAAGETRGLYVTLVAATSIRYTNGVAFGGPRAGDSNLTILEGFGTVYQFAGSFGSPISGASRMWNGRIHYNAPFTEGIGQRPQPGLAVFDINDSVDINGIPLGTLNPNTGMLVRGPFFGTGQQDGQIDFTFNGGTNQPIIMLAGALNPTPVSYGAIGQIDIGGAVDPMSGLPTGIILAANGTAATFPDAFFVTDPTGEMSIGFNISGVFPLGVLTAFQAVMFTGTAQVVAISNAVEVNIVP